MSTSVPEKLALQSPSSIDTLAPPAALWRAALGELQMRVSGACYETWLVETTALSYTDGVFKVAAPNAFVAEMLEQRLFELVLDSVEKVLGCPADLRIEVVGSPASAVAGPATVSGDPNLAVGPEAVAPGLAAQAPVPVPVPVPELSRIPVRLNPAYTFGSFIVGGSNDLAHAAASAVADRPGELYNPLFIHSDVGLGKTHLLTAVGHAIQSRGLSTAYATTEEFTNQYISAIREGKTEEFRARYRSADVLLLDDIQFLIGKEQTQEGFFHTFNALHMDGRQIVVTSDRPIGELTVLQDRVRSRLAGGLVVDIQAPGLETRLAILRAKAEASAMAGRVSTEALELLADLAHRNVRELEGGLNRAIAYAELTGSVVTAETVRRVLSTAVARNRYTPVSQSGVLDAVTAHYSLDLRDLTSRRRDAHTTLARHVAMYLLREDAHMGLAEIGRAFGGRDHSTVLHARNRVSSLMREDDGLRHELADLRRAISAPLLATSP